MMWRDCTIRQETSALEPVDNTLYAHYRLGWVKRIVWGLMA